MKLQKVSIFGLGYIGLPTAAVVASKDVMVHGVDINSEVIETINQGKIHIVEQQLGEMVKNAISNGCFTASTEPEHADVFVIAVPTPYDFQNRTADLSYVYSAVESISKVLQADNLVILTSTSPVGTTEKIAHWFHEFRPDLSFPHIEGSNSQIRIAYCPERVVPGNTIKELKSNDHIIGGISEKCSMYAKTFYEVFVEGFCVVTNTRTAELSKLAENSFRDVNIAFANELSMICAEWDVDVWDLIELSNKHPRVEILNPGPGVGGHCIAIDPWFLISQNPYNSKLLQTARGVNDAKPEWVVRYILEETKKFLAGYGKKSLKGISISVYGLAFKPNVDDLRESPSLKIVEKLGAEFFDSVKVVEPHIQTLPKALAEKNFNLVNMQDALSSKINVLLVNHSQFKKLEHKLIKDSLFINIQKN